MKRLLSSLTIAGAALGCLCAALPAAAQFAKPEDAIKYRQSALTVMGTHFGRIGAVVQGKVPFDAKATADNANIVLAMSPLPYTAFGEGTDKGGNTKAKPQIWKDMDKFQAATNEMQAQVVKRMRPTPMAMLASVAYDVLHGAPSDRRRRRSGSPPLRDRWTRRCDSPSMCAPDRSMWTCIVGASFSPASGN